MSVQSTNTRIGWIFGIAGIVGVLLLAIWLRWQYATQVQLHVDEFTTLWAAQHVQEKGVPLMPSGVLYTRGLLSSYLVAFAQSIAGNAPIVGRTVSVLFGAAAVLAIFLTGRREWTVRVGWVAAVGLTLLPEMIVWSGRARFYSPLVFFSLLTVWAAFVMIQLPASAPSSAARAQWRTSMNFALLFVLSLFSQEQTIFLYPSILIALIAWRGWRFLLQPPIVTAQVVCIGAMALRFVVEQIGQPGYFGAIQEHKSYIQLFDNLAGAWRVYSHLLLSARRLPWSLLMAVAFAAALAAAWPTARAHNDGRRLLDRLSRFHQATLFFGWQFLFVLTLLFTVVGSGWLDSRYLLLIEPYWVLLGAAGLVWLVDRLVRPARWRWIATFALAAALAWWMWPITTNALEQEAEGYQAAMAYVALHRAPNDVVMSPQPPACAWGIGEPCDYYVTQRSWQAYVIPKEDKLIDRWSGAELLNTSTQLVGVLKAAPRVWLITDSQRLGRRFEDDFLRVVVQQFSKVFEADGVAVLLAQGWKEPPPVVASQQYEQPVQMGALSLVGWERGAITDEGRVPVTFYWVKTDEIRQQINTSMQIVAQDGSAITQDDGPPARGMTSTFDFDRVVLPDPKSPILPAAQTPGRYRIDVAAYQISDHELLSEPVAVDWIWLGPPVEPPAVTLNKAWQDGVLLIGHDALPVELQPGRQLDVRLVWGASHSPGSDYTVFMHLLDEDGVIIAQNDRAPEGGFYPTSRWREGDVVADLYQLALPEILPQTQMRLVAGLYDPTTGLRALLLNGEDSGEDTVEIATFGRTEGG